MMFYECITTVHDHHASWQEVAIHEIKIYSNLNPQLEEKL